MKTISCVVLRTSFVYFMLVLAGLAPAQNLPPDLTPISSEQLAAFGHSYYSIQRFPWCPPLPLNWLSDEPGVQLYVSPSLGTHAVFVDDTAIDYGQRAANRAAQAANSLEGPPPPGEVGGSGSGGGGGTNSYANSYGTNDLWLEPLSLSSNLFSVILHGTTNGSTYLITSTETLNASATNTWRVEGSLQGTNDSTQFALGVAARTNSLFIRAEACEECATTALPLWWQLARFGVTGADPSGDYDADGSTNLTEYLEGTDPNTIKFSIAVTNQYTSQSAMPLQLKITGGVPSNIAVLVNTTNGSWQPFTSTNLLIPTPTNGAYVVNVGLCGLAPDATQTWHSITLFRDATPLTLVLTNPTALHGSRPYLDPAGYTTRSLKSITWAAVAPNGTTNSGNGLLVDRSWDGHDDYHTTNWFECVDVLLFLGGNNISIRVEDWAGTVAETNFMYFLDTTGDETGPSLSLIWPQNGTHVYGDRFNVQAWTDDDTSVAALRYTDADGIEQTLKPVLERGGNLWAHQVPLRSGTNHFSLQATDAAGNMTTTNFMVIQSDAAWSVTPLTQEELKYGYATVRGTIADPDATISVNGIQGTNCGNGSWAVFNVPLPSGGAVAVQAKAHLASGEMLEALLIATREPIVFTQTYGFELDYSYVFMAADGWPEGVAFVHTEAQWSRGAGGTNRQTVDCVYYDAQNVWTNRTEWVTVWPADSGYWPSLPGQKVVSYYRDGELYWIDTGTVGAPSVEWMERSSGSGTARQLGFDVPYSVSSGRDVRVFTGAPADRSGRQLLRLRAPLVFECDPAPNVQSWPEDLPEYEDFLAFLQPDSPPVPVPSPVTHLDPLGYLDNEGNLLTLLPCGIETGATPEAPGPAISGPLPP